MLKNNWIDKLILIYKTYLLFAFTNTSTQSGTHKIRFKTLSKTFTALYLAASGKVVHVGLNDSFQDQDPPLVFKTRQLKVF